MRALRAFAHHAARLHSSPPPPLTTTPTTTTTPTRRPDGYALLAPELQHVRSSLLGLLGSGHPGLNHVAGYCFLEPSQQLRSLLVLLFAHATNGLGALWPTKHSAAALEAHTALAVELDTPLTRPDVLNNWHPSMPNNSASFSGVFDLRPVGLYTPPPTPAPSPASRVPALASPPRLLPTQLRLAQIVEMIHIASVLHDDVHDASLASPDPDTTKTDGFGNKLSILAGDFLLGRASTALSRLGEAEVVELIASVISNQAEGEMLRIHGPGTGTGTDTDTDPWDVYLRKTYLKTASLMAKGACASVVLGGCSGNSTIWKDAAYTYGRNLGIAYQLVEDTLEHSAHDAGPVHGLITGPILFAAEEHTDLHPLIRRNLAGEGDVEKAMDYVARSEGIERTRALAVSYADKAKEALVPLPESEHREALEVLAECAVTRTW